MVGRAAAVAAMALLVVAIPGTASAQGGDDGRDLYQQSCSGCHSADGAGIPGTFPPLAGNPKAADEAYVSDVIRNGLSGPIEVLGVAYDGAMPPITQLDDAQITAVAGYVQSLAAPAGDGAPTTTSTSSPAPIGDRVRGEALFIGADRMENGGPACYSCHAAGAYSQFGAGLGPELTTAASRLGGEPGLAAWLINPPSPTMQPIFADKPMSPTEIADVSAFLAGVQPGEGGLDWLLIGGLAGLGLLLATLGLVVKGPRPAYVERLKSNDRLGSAT